jgi:hypothetical protein
VGLTPDAVRAYCAAKLAEVDARLVELRRLRRYLRAKLGAPPGRLADRHPVEPPAPTARAARTGREPRAVGARPTRAANAPPGAIR